MRQTAWLYFAAGSILAGIGLIVFSRSEESVGSESDQGRAKNRIVVERPVVDLGKVRQGTTHAASYRLTNHTPSTVQLAVVWSSCDCTRVDVPNDPLPPGAEADIPMTWRIGGHRGLCGSRVILSASQADGPVEQFVLRVQAEVLPDVGLAPKHLTFTRGRSATQEIKVGPLAAVVAVDSVHSPRPFVRATFDRGRQVVDVSYDGPADPRDSDWVTLDVRTTSPNEPSIRYTVWLVDDETSVATTGRPQ